MTECMTVFSWKFLKKPADIKDLLKNNLAACIKHLKMCLTLEPIRPKNERRVYIQSYFKKFIDNGKNAEI